MSKKWGSVHNEETGNDAIKQQFFDLERVTESDLTYRFKKAHQSLWGGGELNPSDAFDELDKLIFCKIWDERQTKKGYPYDFQIFDIEKPKNATQEEIDAMASISSWVAFFGFSISKIWKSYGYPFLVCRSSHILQKMSLSNSSKASDGFNSPPPQRD